MKEIRKAAWFIFSTAVYFAFLTAALFMAIVFSKVLPKDEKMTNR